MQGTGPTAALSTDCHPPELKRARSAVLLSQANNLSQEAKVELSYRDLIIMAGSAQAQPVIQF